MRKVTLVEDETLIRRPVKNPLAEPPVELIEDPSTLPPPPPEPLNFGERVAGYTEDRIQNVQGAVNRYEQGETTYPEVFYSGLGNTAGIFTDAVGEGVMTALASVTPDNWEEYLKEQIVAGASSVMSTDEAKQALELWRNTPPRVREVVVNSLDVAGVVAPKGPLKKLGGFLKKGAIRAEKDAIAEHVLSQGPTARQKRVSEIGQEETPVANFEDRVLDTVLSLKGVSGSASPSKIMGAVNRELYRLRNSVNTSIMDIKTTVPKGAVNQNVFEAFSELVQKNPIFNADSMKPKTKRVFEAYRAALKDYPSNGSADALMQVRRKFDKNIETMFKKDIHAGDDAHREVVAMVRNQLNDMVEALAPDEEIKTQLQRMHKLLVAKSDLAVNLAGEKGFGAKISNWVAQHPIIVGSAVTGGGGMLTNALAAPLTGPALVAGAAAYGATRPSVRRGAGTFLEEAPVGRGLLYGASNELQQIAEEQEGNQ